MRVFFIFKRIDETQFGLVEVVLRTTPIGVTVFMILMTAVKMCPHTFFRAVPADEDRLVILRVPGGIRGLRDCRRAQQMALTRRERRVKNAEVFLNCVYERSGRFVERAISNNQIWRIFCSGGANVQLRYISSDAEFPQFESVVSNNENLPFICGTKQASGSEALSGSQQPRNEKAVSHHMQRGRNHAGALLIYGN